MRLPTHVLIVLVVLATAPAAAATICHAPLSSLDGWSVHTLGSATARVVQDAATGNCVELASAGGTVLLSREFELPAVQGCRVSVGCLIQTQDVSRGPQLVSTAKLHLAVETAADVKHASARFTGTRPWQREGFTADVPADARRVVLNVGLEACSGRMRLANLLVHNDRLGVRPLPMASVANAEHGQLGLGAFPDGRVEWNKIPFEILNVSENASGDCVRIAGEGRADWPRATAAPIPVATGATAIYILHGTLGTSETTQGTGTDRPDRNQSPVRVRETPCVIWTAKYVGGQEASLSVFEGRQIGCVGQTADLENWRVAWTERDAQGNPVTFGVTKWTLYGDAPLESISCRAYRGSPVVVLAVTAVEEPARQPEPGLAPQDDEVEGEIGE